MRHQDMEGSEYGPVAGLVGRFWPRRAAEMRYVECGLRRIHLPRTPVNRGAVAWQPRLLLLFEQQLLLCQSASAAHTALPSARRKASKTPGGPSTGLSCSLTDTVTERLPFGLAARNWV
jgi:hypothetical protein